ncbi:DMT family transporter [Chondrinema litorale]|uniref:DMT family transporter n=1 Tax=Chondrinema litorale TaxID=2994555 RepID=UPI002543C705|nr:DMT family transporter [Chondrinema litorale]UZR92344.1 DMT family transporter [Chondrinema litorale]
MEKANKSSITIHLALFSVAFLYGANYNIAKLATPEFISPSALVVLRVVFSTIFFWVSGVFIKSQPIPRKAILSLLLCSVFGTAGTQMLFLKGLSLTSPINASVIMTLTPVMVLLISFFFAGEHLNRFKFIGIALGIIGAFFLVGGQNFSFSGENALGDFIIVLNASVFASYLVLVKKFMLEYHPITVIKWVFLLGCPMVIPFGYNELVHLINWNELPSFVWLSLIYVIIGATFLVYLLNTIALSKANPSLVGFYIYFQPVVSTLIAIAFFNEVLTIEKIFFSLMIFTGVWLVGKKKKPLQTEKL